LHDEERGGVVSVDGCGTCVAEELEGAVGGWGVVVRGGGKYSGDRGIIVNVDAEGQWPDGDAAVRIQVDGCGFGEEGETGGIAAEELEIGGGRVVARAAGKEDDSRGPGGIALFAAAIVLEELGSMAERWYEPNRLAGHVSVEQVLQGPAGGIKGEGAIGSSVT
jgi:hypothetical protein